ncbi:MAG: hypothetical protein MUP82_09590 [Candidatus Marinimicrobia bacterium]|nr:hypothetical protein [Candidatus Neomarinimicrobiota bacterium]
MGYVANYPCMCVRGHHLRAVSCENKKIAFRTRDANSSINIMKLTSCWIDSQTRPTAFHSHISSFTCSTTKEEQEKARPS